jgi:four helix bundle protein
LAESSPIGTRSYSVRCGAFARDHILRDQARRAVISIMSNIAEGFERDGNSELIQFYPLQKALRGGLRAQLMIAFDCGHIDAKCFAELHAAARDVSGKLGALIAYLRNSGMRGVKFKT